MLFHPWENPEIGTPEFRNLPNTWRKKKNESIFFFVASFSQFSLSAHCCESVGRPVPKMAISSFLPLLGPRTHAHTRTHAVKRLWPSVPFVFPVRFSFLFPIFYPRPISSVDLRPVIGKTDKLALEDAAFSSFFSHATHTHTYERNLPFSITWRSFRLGFPHFVKCCVRCKWKQKKEQKEILYWEGGAGFNEQIFFFSSQRCSGSAHEQVEKYEDFYGQPSMDSQFTSSNSGMSWIQPLVKKL